MKQKIKELLLTMILFLGLINLQAQETITVTGSEATGSGTVSYTVGQITYTTSAGENGNSVSQGVQQAYEISVVTGIFEAKEINLSISAFPNPTSDFLNLTMENNNFSDLKFKLYDVNGKLLKNEKIVADKTNISTNDLVPAIYFLEISDNKKILKNFKIIKK